MTLDEQAIHDIFYAIADTDIDGGAILRDGITWWFGKQEDNPNERIETSAALWAALADWTDRWLRDPQHDALRARGDALWQLMNEVHGAFIVLRDRCKSLTQPHKHTELTI